MTSYAYQWQDCNTLGRLLLEHEWNDVEPLHAAAGRRRPYDPVDGDGDQCRGIDVGEFRHDVYGRRAGAGSAVEYGAAVD